MSFGSQAVELLRQYDVDTTFGIPGVHTIEYYRGVQSTGMRSFVPRHEQGAGFMADGYNRITGKPGVCILVTGPGVLNAATPLAQAWHDSRPMLYLAAATETKLAGRNRGPLHDIPDQAGMLQSLCSYSVTVTDPEEYCEVVAKVWHAWRTGRPRPAHIAIPTDLLVADVAPLSMHAIAEKAPDLDHQALAAAAALLAESQSPVIIAGGGANHAAEVIRRLAERTGAAVVTTGNARGLLPHDHPLSLGTLLPFPETQRLIAAADVVLAIGTEFSDVDVIYTGAVLSRPKRLIRVDIDPAQLDQPFSADVAIAGDAGVVVAQLVQAIGPGEPNAADTSAALVRAARAAVPWTDQSRSHMPWIDALAAATPANAMVSIDSTQLAYTAQHYQPWSLPGRWLAPYGTGTLGPALPMGLGASAGDPASPLLVIAGDGGCLFTLTELATAVDMNAPMVMVIWDNAGYSEIRDSFDRADAPRIGVDTTAFDLVTIARGFGANATRVTAPDQLQAAVAAGFAAKRPTVVVATEPGSPADRH